MKTYEMKPRSVPLDDSWDVVVAGGGPAGCAAAIAAAREGARTLLVEATGALGGMGTSGLVPAWCPFSDKERIIYGGIAEKVFTESKKGVPHEPEAKLDWVAINPEQLKRVYDDLLAEAGATVVFNTTLAAVEADEGKVAALVLASKSGLTAVAAPVYVDCTGDADLAVWAGAQFEKGDLAGELQPATHCFILSNVDTYAWRHGSRLSREGLARMLESGKYPLLEGAHVCNHIVGPGTVGFNAGHIWDVDNTDPGSVSAALVTGRRLVAQYRDALAEFLPAAFANSFVPATGTLIGARETRRIVGDYVLTIDDFLARASFPDEICRNSYPVDIHITRDEIEAEKRGEAHAMKRYEHYGKGESHGIPYRCLTPKGIANVLVAGRSISTDREVQGSTRVMPVCLAMGEAAGLAAQMAASDDGDVHAVDTGELRARLKGHGAYLPDIA